MEHNISEKMYDYHPQQVSVKSTYMWFFLQTVDQQSYSSKFSDQGLYILKESNTKGMGHEIRPHKVIFNLWVLPDLFIPRSSISDIMKCDQDTLAAVVLLFPMISTWCQENLILLMEETLRQLISSFYQ